MFATGLGIVGRDAELAAIARFLDGGPGQTAYALLLEGELGIGKSTVLGAGLELARERQYRVLACASASEETRLSFVAVADLLAPVLELSCDHAMRRSASRTTEVSLQFANGT